MLRFPSLFLLVFIFRNVTYDAVHSVIVEKRQVVC